MFFLIFFRLFRFPVKWTAAPLSRIQSSRVFTPFTFTRTADTWFLGFFSFFLFLLFVLFDFGFGSLWNLSMSQTFPKFPHYRFSISQSTYCWYIGLSNDSRRSKNILSSYLQRLPWNFCSCHSSFLNSLDGMLTSAISIHPYF